MNTHEIKAEIAQYQAMIQKAENELARWQEGKRQSSINAGLGGFIPRDSDPVAENYRRHINVCWQAIFDLQKKLPSADR